MNRETAKAIHQRVTELLETVKSEFGLDLVKDRGQFGSDNYHLSLEWVEVKKNGKVKCGAEDLELGLAPYGTKVIGMNGKRFTIINARRTKYVIESAENKKRYVCAFGWVALVK